MHGGSSTTLVGDAWARGAALNGGRQLWHGRLCSIDRGCRCHAQAIRTAGAMHACRMGALDARLITSSGAEGPERCSTPELESATWQWLAAACLTYLVVQASAATMANGQVDGGVTVVLHAAHAHRGAEQPAVWSTALVPGYGPAQSCKAYDASIPPHHHPWSSRRAQST